jgi:subtilisin family serine protease
MTFELPPRYYWLWHLAALRVIDADFGALPKAPPDPGAHTVRSAVPGITGTRWDEIPAGASASVALIDTGVSRKHPNLASRIDVARSIDLTSHRYGARHDTTPGATPSLRERPQAFFTGLSLDGLDLAQLAPQDHAFLTDMVADYARSTGVVRHLSEPEETIAAHGTACAGLMVGNPALLPGAGLVQIGGAGAVLSPGVLPYFGVDPFSSLVSIRTAFEQDAEQFIAAFLYAYRCGVQAIVLPRGLPDPVRSRLAPLPEFDKPCGRWDSRVTDDLIARRGVPADGPDPAATQAAHGHRPERAWDVLRAIVIAVSKRIPVFCAAGNDAESQLIYPANLAAPDNGIVAVGAVTAEGYRAGYSNYGERLTLVMPSDDYEVLNRHQSRIDRSDPMIAMHDFDSIGTATRVPFCPLELVTTDLPGVFGYDQGRAPWSAILDQGAHRGIGGGYYTAFGGTSGASCLAGGLAVLAQRARLANGKEPLSGVAMKQALQQSADLATVVLPGTRPLSRDAMNRDDEASDQVDKVADKDEAACDRTAESLARFFGAGLPDAKRLMSIVLAMG